MTTATRIESLSVVSERRGGSRTVRLAGALDLAVCEQLTDELGRVEASGATTLIVDLRELEFIDSAGIEALVKAKDRWRENGGRLELLCVPGAVQRLLQMTGSPTLLAIA